MFRVTRDVYDRFVELSTDEYPLEACGLIAGPEASSGVRFYPCRNAAESARVYTIDPKDHLRAELDADDHDWEITGVVHSHTHSPAYPSPTDVGAAVDPAWHYVIVSLRNEDPEVESFRIVDGEVVAEEIVVLDETEST